MCGRYSLHSSPHVVALQFGLAHAIEYEARYNVAPGSPVLAVRADASHARSGAWLRWGLIPSWARDPGIGNRLINARAETVVAKPSFRAAFQRRRCIIPANGYYEWTAAGGRRQPYYIRPNGDELFGFAGLYEQWYGADPPIESCTIITTDANALTRRVHSRMPVILPDEAQGAWVDTAMEAGNAVTLARTAATSAVERLEHYAVDLRVNDARVDEPRLTEPVSAGTR